MLGWSVLVRLVFPCLGPAQYLGKYRRRTTVADAPCRSWGGAESGCGSRGVCAETLLVVAWEVSYFVVSFLLSPLPFCSFSGRGRLGRALAGQVGGCSSHSPAWWASALGALASWPSCRSGALGRGSGGGARPLVGLSPPLGVGLCACPRSPGVWGPISRYLALVSADTLVEVSICVFGEATVVVLDLKRLAGSHRSPFAVSLFAW